jgi:hypothetical protein
MSDLGRLVMSGEGESKEKTISRRKALSILGLAAPLGYVVPTMLTVTDAEAQARRRTERRTRRRTRRRTERRTRRHRTSSA